MEFDEAVDRSGAGVAGAVGGPVGEEGVLPLAERFFCGGRTRERARRHGRQFLLCRRSSGLEVGVVVGLFALVGDLPDDE